MEESMVTEKGEQEVLVLFEEADVVFVNLQDLKMFFVLMKKIKQCIIIGEED